MHQNTVRQRRSTNLENPAGIQPAAETPRAPGCVTAHRGWLVFWLISLVAGLAVLSLPAAPGVIETRSGRTLEGDITLEPGAGFLVTQTNRSVARSVPMEELRRARFGRGAASEPAAAARPPGPLPSPWRSADVGTVQVPGQSCAEGSRLVVRASGTNLWEGGRDQGHFVYQKGTGDGSVVACLDQADARWAGVMMRKDLGADSEFVLAAVNARSGQIVFCARRSAEYREKYTTEGGQQIREGFKPPVWLRLERSGKAFTAYVSRNPTAQWELLGTSRGRHAAEEHVGLFVLGGEPDRLESAAFSQTTVHFTKGPGSEKRDPPGVLPSPTDEVAAFQPQVHLRDGSILRGRILQVDPSGVRVEFLGEDRFFSSVQVARVLFRPLPPRGASSLTSGRAGVMLTSGDFIEGEVAAVRSKTLVIDSVLLGQRKVDLEAKVVALVWREVAPSPAGFVLRLVEGSELRCDSLETDESGLALPGFGASPLRLSLNQFVEIRRE